MSEQTHGSMPLYKVSLFHGVRGERIEERILLNDSGTAPMTEEEKLTAGLAIPSIQYIGIVPMVNNIPTLQGICQIPTDTRFSITASSPKEALEKFGEVVQELSRKLQEHNQKMKEAEESKDILVPTPAETKAFSKKEGLKLVRE